MKSLKINVIWKQKQHFQCLWKINFLHIWEFNFINLGTQMDTVTLEEQCGVWYYVFMDKDISHRISFQVSLVFTEVIQRDFRVRYWHHRNTWLFTTFLNLVDIEKCETSTMSWMFIIFPTIFFFCRISFLVSKCFYLDSTMFLLLFLLFIMVIFFIIISRFYLAALYIPRVCSNVTLLSHKQLSASLHRSLFFSTSLSFRVSLSLTHTLFHLSHIVYNNDTVMIS